MDDDEPSFGFPFFDDLAKLLSSQPDQSWMAARQMAIMLASGGASEANVDPLERIKIEELTRIAELHVGTALGLTVPSTRQQPTVIPVTRSDWAARTLDAYRPIFESLSGSLARQPDQPEAGDPTDPASAMFSQLMGMVAPQMLGMATGSMVGHLARRSLGGYDLPLPRPAGDQLLLIAPNLAEISAEWNLDSDDLRLWVLLRELAHHTIFGVPHVRAEIERLVLDHASGYRPDPRALEDRLAGIDPADPSSLSGIQEVFSDPEVLLGAVRSDIQRSLLPYLDAVVAVVTGVVDHVLETAGGALLGGDRGQLDEALRRRHGDDDRGDQFLGRLIGIELGEATTERGRAFVTGVIERAGTDGLWRLWADEQELPTPAEVDAPGLWLARIDLD